MALVKCPRCELNYMQEHDKYCTVCRREMKGEDDAETLEICTECGEHRAVPGEELCIYCLKEIKRTEGVSTDDRAITIEEGGVLGLTAASAMDEIEIEVEDDDEETIPSVEYKEIGRELKDDEEEPEPLEIVEESELLEDEDSEE